MSYNSTIADYISRVNVALKAKKEFVFVPYTRLTLMITKLILNNGCIRFFSVIYSNTFIKNNKSLQMYIKIHFLYDKNSIPVIKKIKLISKNSSRIYWSLNNISYNFNKNAFSGYYIISTSKGMYTSTDLILGSCTNTKINLSGGEVFLKIIL